MEQLKPVPQTRYQHCRHAVPQCHPLNVCFSNKILCYSFSTVYPQIWSGYHQVFCQDFEEAVRTYRTSWEYYPPCLSHQLEGTNVSYRSELWQLFPYPWSTLDTPSVGWLDNACHLIPTQLLSKGTSPSLWKLKLREFILMQSYFEICLWGSSKLSLKYILLERKRKLWISAIFFVPTWSSHELVFDHVFKTLFETAAPHTGVLEFESQLSCQVRLPQHVPVGGQHMMVQVAESILPPWESWIMCPCPRTMNVWGENQLVGTVFPGPTAQIYKTFTEWVINFPSIFCELFWNIFVCNVLEKMFNLKSVRQEQISEQPL